MKRLVSMASRYEDGLRRVTTTPVTLTEQQTKSLLEGIEYNLRGLNTYNLVKRVIWSSVTHRPDGDLNKNSQINLPLLKGLLNEVYMELYVEDFLNREGL